MASAAKCGTLLWKSSAPKVVPDLMAPVRKPLPNELHGMFPANSLRARFGQADVFHFPFHNQLFYHACDVFNRHIRVDHNRV